MFWRRCFCFFLPDAPKVTGLTQAKRFPELEQLQKSLLEEKNQPATPPEKIECYYTASGSVYHKDRNCSFLKNAKEVLGGTIEEATVTRALRPCSRCAVEKTEEEGGESE